MDLSRQAAVLRIPQATLLAIGLVLSIFLSACVSSKGTTEEDIRRAREDALSNSHNRDTARSSMNNKGTTEDDIRRAREDALSKKEWNRTIPFDSKLNQAERELAALEAREREQEEQRKLAAIREQIEQKKRQIEQRESMPESDVDVPPSIGLSPHRNAYAIVVGIEQYQQQLPKADFAAHDAEVISAYLTKTLGYAEHNVVLLLNDRATKTGIEKYIEAWLPDHVENGDSVFIYFSGHGAPNSKTGKAYLVPYDGDPAFVDKTGYSLDRLYNSLAALPAKEVVVMLDSCFSGAGGRSVIAEGMRPMMLSVENPVLTDGKIVVLAASSGSQISSTYKKQRHGMLTYYFLKGLLGEADQNHDNRIELGELFIYLKPQVERTARRESHNEQTPQLIGSPDMLSRGLVLVGARDR